MADDTDAALLARWRAGDARAGQQLFERHFDSVFAFFATKSPADANDLVQSTFLACVKSRDDFRGDASFRTYMFTIARNELYRLLRSRQREQAKLDVEHSSIAELVTTPRTKLARNEDHERMIEALQQLPVEQQVLLELHYWEDLGIADLAEISGAPEATVRTRLHRARRALRDQIQRDAPPDALASLEGMDAWARAVRQKS